MWRKAANSIDAYLKMNPCFIDALKNGCNSQLFILVVRNLPG
jgi:hypothetical protein